MITQKKGALSLQYKLLFLLIIVPLVTLSAYLWLAIDTFKTDKIAYVFDTSASRSRVLATQVRTEIVSLKSVLKPVVEGFDIKRNLFDSISKKIFDEDAMLEHLVVLKDPTGTSRAVLEKRTPLPENLREQTEVSARRLAPQVFANQLALLPLQTDVPEPRVLFGMRYDIKGESFAVIALAKVSGFTRLFMKKELYSSFLVDEAGDVLIGPIGASQKNFSSWRFFKEIKEGGLPEKVSDTLDPNGNELLASFSSVGLGALSVVTFIDKGQALRAVKILLSKSALFFVALISAAVIVSVIAAGKLTFAFRELSEASAEIATGNFKIEIPIRSRDEVGELAKNFNTMAGEVSRLMTENVAKARMEKELETAKTVQETLFPDPDFKSKTVELSGHYESASECGGDWWSYCVVGPHLLIWIGDVTGHGAPAALLTSAAKSAASIIEVLGIDSPAKIVEILNHAIHSTSKGNLMMTFFLGALNQETGELTYVNASHNFPLLIKNTGTSPTKADLYPLVEGKGSRLGESLTSKYTEAKLRLQKGDQILFYTDGAMDLLSPDNKSYGKSNWYRTVLTAVSDSPEPKESVERIRAQLHEFRQGTSLPDDVTFMVCRYSS